MLTGCAHIKEGKTAVYDSVVLDKVIKATMGADVSYEITEEDGRVIVHARGDRYRWSDDRLIALSE